MRFNVLSPNITCRESKFFTSIRSFRNPNDDEPTKLKMEDTNPANLNELVNEVRELKKCSRYL